VFPPTLFESFFHFGEWEVLFGKILDLDLKIISGLDLSNDYFGSIVVTFFALKQLVTSLSAKKLRDFH